MTGPPNENPGAGTPGRDRKAQLTVAEILPPRPLPSPRVSIGRWCFTCGGHLLKDESGPHCNQCLRWDRVIRGLQAAPQPRPIKRVTLLGDHVEALYLGGDPFLREVFTKDVTP